MKALLFGKSTLAVVLAMLLAMPIPASGQYVATWPIKEAEWRDLARQRLAAKEHWIRVQMEGWLTVRRQMILLGEDPQRWATEVEFARSMLKEYLADVLTPRIEAAANGCREGVDALGYWLAYWRQAQLLGVAGDAETSGDADFFVTIAGRTYTSVYDIPEQLLPTTVENCFREDYQHCVASGDFPRLVGRLFTWERQMQLLGRDMEPAWIALMVGYLQRCGHWELEMTTRFRSEVVGTGVSATGTVRRTIPLAWKPGSGEGLNAIYGATIDGTAEPRADRIAFTSGECTTVAGPLSVNAPAEAHLMRLQWEYPDDPATPDWAASGFPIRLALSVEPGSLRTTLTFRCPRSARGRVTPIPTQLPFLFDVVTVGVMATLGHAEMDRDAPNGLVFATGWEFTALNPFRARLVQEGSLAHGGAAVAGRIELDLRHVPQ